MKCGLPGRRVMKCGLSDLVLFIHLLNQCLFFVLQRSRSTSLRSTSASDTSMKARNGRPLTRSNERSITWEIKPILWEWWGQPEIMKVVVDGKMNGVTWNISNISNSLRGRNLCMPYCHETTAAVMFFLMMHTNYQTQPFGCIDDLSRRPLSLAAGPGNGKQRGVSSAWVDGDRPGGSYSSRWNELMTWCQTHIVAVTGKGCSHDSQFCRSLAGKGSMCPILSITKMMSYLPSWASFAALLRVNSSQIITPWYLMS